jgi:hypothetical protein
MENEKTTLKCEWIGCSHAFQTTLELKNHIEGIHLGNNKGSYSCEWKDCKFGTRRKLYDLKTHVSLHHKHLTYTCEICHKGFMRDQELRKHRNTNTPCKKKVETGHHPVVPSKNSLSMETISYLDSPQDHISPSSSYGSSDYESPNGSDLFVPVLNENKKRQFPEQQEAVTKRERIELKTSNGNESGTESETESEEEGSNESQESIPKEISLYLQEFENWEPEYQELEFSDISERSSSHDSLTKFMEEGSELGSDICNLLFESSPNSSPLLAPQQVPSWTPQKPAKQIPPLSLKPNNQFAFSSFHNNNLFYRDPSGLPTFASLNSSNYLQNTPSVKPLSSPCIPTSPSSYSNYFFPSSPPSSFFIPLSHVAPISLEQKKPSWFGHPSVISTKTSPVRMASTTIPNRTSGFFPLASASASPSLSSSPSSSAPISVSVPTSNISTTPTSPKILPLPLTGRIIVESSEQLKKNHQKLLSVTDLFQTLDIKKEEKDEGVPPKPNFMQGKRPPTDPLITNPTSSTRAITIIEKILKRV